ncbi:tetratricopeptide repeat protein [Turneriella parva]|uniref:Tetratricopeptide TPR_1 repeat-containing protein n=1 Tax=Turneriella parva (strain ATCC BAA-1111 / DSM 21527 / NCTC 11395 / H) TaxID=869212 RepID=I4BAY8_TURPD|nr:tetratricopeptide repeat protein [Turneriella parva]AFM14445.1 Tetratricopeptide TPR_1 repeat-containing protein [Turneriella parva DSM 21527]
MAEAHDTGRARRTRNLLFEQALEAEKKGDLKAALEKYKMALQIDQNFFDAWLNAGAIYTRQGKGDKAITCYQRALVSKNDVRGHYNLAVEYYKKGDFKESEKALKSVLKLDTRYLNAHLLLGYVYGKTGRNDKSEISIRNALKIDPQNYQAQTALALLYFHTDRPELALRQVNILLTKAPEDKVLLGLSAKISLSGGDLRQAAAGFRKVAARDPELKKFYESLRGEVPQEKKKSIRQKREKIETQAKKTAKDMLDLSLLQFFDGEPEHALATLEKLTAALEAKKIKKP